MTTTKASTRKRDVLTLKKSPLKSTSAIKNRSIEIQKPKKSRKTNPYFPDGYGLFRLHKKNFKVSQDAVTELNRFLYRYRLAKNFKGIILEEKKHFDKTLHGYESAMKVFLAYTAFEALYNGAEGLDIAKAVFDKKEAPLSLAIQLRSNTKLKNLLYSKINNKTNEIKLNKFYEKETSNILNVAYIIRSSFAHGSLTSLGAGLDNLTNLENLLQISNLILEHCNDVFDICVENCLSSLRD